MSDYDSSSSTCETPDYEKDPDSTTDFAFNWAPHLDGDSIATSTFVLPDGLTEVSSSNTTTTATIFVSGGSACRTYRITSRVTTAGGRTWDRTIRIRVKEQ